VPCDYVGRMRVLHLAPHPDDEVLGAGATLLALLQAGHEVTNLAVSLGRRGDRERRRHELERACGQLGLPLEVLEPPLDMSGGEGDDLDAAEERLDASLRERLSAYDLVIAPSPHDQHPGHELVGRAAAQAVAQQVSDPPRLWLWSLWSSLALPTTIAGFDEPALVRLDRALREHRSQLERNGYDRLLRAKAIVDAVLGPERVLGFAGSRLGHPYAELTCELVRVGQKWLLGASRELDPAHPFPSPTSVDATDWLAGPSGRASLGESR
jgi:LmbE family N-acetylglucosaminyl deacetylase